MKKTLYAIAICTGALSGAFAQISLTGTSPTYASNFNSYAGTAASLPAGWTTTGGDSLYKNTGTGTANSGGFYAYGSGGDFSLGALRSGSLTLTYIGSFVNNTGRTITALTLAWDYEQWRYANTSGLNLTGTGDLASNAILNGKDFTGTASGTSGTGSVTPVTSFTLSGLNITNGEAFGFSWVTTDGSGADNGVSIDNFSLGAITAVPEPHEYGLAFAGVLVALIVIRRRRASRANEA